MACRCTIILNEQALRKPSVLGGGRTAGSGLVLAGNDGRDTLFAFIIANFSEKERREVNGNGTDRKRELLS
jgi:hypothetical protein